MKLDIRISDNIIIANPTRGEKVTLKNSRKENNNAINRKPPPTTDVKVNAKIRLSIKYLNIFFIVFLTLQVAYF